eukprot:scaffold23659_cov36-Tisochrysis_lutea.AAC.5
MSGVVHETADATSASLQTTWSRGSQPREAARRECHMLDQAHRGLRSHWSPLASLWTQASGDVRAGGAGARRERVPRCIGCPGSYHHRSHGNTLSEMTLPSGIGHNTSGCRSIAPGQGASRCTTQLLPQMPRKVATARRHTPRSRRAAQSERAAHQSAGRECACSTR